MQWYDHSKLKGTHAFLSASQWHWLNYDDKKLVDRWQSAQAVEMGTRLHAYAEETIRLGIKQRPIKRTLNMYINDAIGFDLEPEVVLYYSDLCYGTADAIGFKNNLLRIHDLKTGVIKAHFEQLRIYAAIFCLEYGIKPGDINFELRIYQNNEIRIENPDATIILPVMDKIQRADKILHSIQND